MKKILCIGEALIDMICSDKGHSLSDGVNFLKKAGGAPANVAAAIGALGGKVSLAAKVGADPFGLFLIDLIKNFNVDTRYLFKTNLSFTTFAFVSLMENGERDFYFNRGADMLLHEDETDSIRLEDYGIMHFGSATAFLEGSLNKAYLSLLEKAKKNNHFISFDPNYRHLLFAKQQQRFIEQSWHYLQNCHFFKVSDEEALLLTNASNLDEAVKVFHKKLQATFAITLGSSGTLLSYKGQTRTIESIPVSAIDTTGAGDAFVGGVLYQLSQLNNKDIRLEEWEKIVFNANKAGARTCMYMGAMEAFKHLNQYIFD
jgi:fructokinase